LAIRALEGDGRVLGGVQEIGAAQMIVALRLSAPKVLGVDSRFDGQW